MSKLILQPHQRRAGYKLASKIKQYGIAILAGEVRSGKTLSFIRTVELLGCSKVLIITKKDAIKSIKEHINPLTTIVTNFEQVKNIKDNNFDLVIIDEFHSKISNASPKCTKKTLYKDIHKVTYNVPCIFSSGTPTPEGYTSIYSALSLCKYSPFNKYKNFVEWHKDYGIKDLIVRGYDKVKRQPLYANNWKKGKTNKIKKALEYITVSITQKEAGHKFFPVDNLIDIPFTTRQKRIFNELEKHRLYELKDNYSIVCDKSNLIQKQHQIGGGFVVSEYDFDDTKRGIYKFNRIPKVEFIKENYDLDKTIIFCYYKAELEYLQSIFPNVESITKKAEGTDYSHFDKIVIYSFSFRAVVYEQIRARQMNFKKRDKEIVIDFLMSAIDYYIYNAVSAKKNFTLSWYNKQRN